MTNKIAIVTTFSNKDFDRYPKAMIQSIAAYWPQEVDLFVQLDEEPESDNIRQKIVESLEEIGIERVVNISMSFSDAQKEFLARNKNNPKVPESSNYRFQYVKFSYKVFALKSALGYALANEYTHLIWVDADVITKKKIKMEDIEKLLPTKEDGVSYLGRKDWNHSECGFMAFDLTKEEVSLCSGTINIDHVLGASIINNLYNDYTTDNVLSRQEWHDSYVFDEIRKELKIDGKNLSEGVEGRDVFDRCVLSEWMEHLKGNRKNKGVKAEVARTGPMNIDAIKIQTQNCVDHDVILKNISENLSLIDHWVEPLKENDEEIIMASAGPSLSPMDFLDSDGKRKNNHKIVAVKHSMDRLLSWGIVPWACLLLDPRPHVETFVQDPHPDVIYFVASMVDPSVVKTLKSKKAKIIGYHAFVGAEEYKVIPNEQLICGGSATSTRGLSVFEVLGFKTFHLYGYDLCSLVEPDLQEKKQNGKLVWEKITMSVKTWGGKETSRTFWTKGEFLAQAKEFKDIYMHRKSLRLIAHGDGMIPWIQKNQKAYEDWANYHYKQNYNGKFKIGEFLEEVFNARESTAVGEST